MSKMKSFFIGLSLLAIMFACVLLCVLIYTANRNSSIKSYIFQINNIASQRVGALQDINEMSAIDLRNKLIRTYVSEYFRVTPNETNVTDRPLLQRLSTTAAYEQWQNGEAKIISKMSADKMLRRVVHITDADIATMNMPEGYDYYSANPPKYIFYKVQFHTETWPESNKMEVEPTYESGVLYIEAKFKPGIDEKKDVRETLKSGKNPMGLFVFRVLSVRDEANQW